MANRASFQAAVLGFWLVLVPGASPSGAAEPFFLDPAAVDTTQAPPSALAPHIDLLGERPVEDAGSVVAREAEALTPAAVARPSEQDPWAEAFAEAVRLRSIAVPVSVAPSYPVVSNAQVQFFLDRFTRERRAVVGVWLNRSGRFLDMIRDTLRKHGLPEELAFTAMIESGFNPVAVSHAGAKGLWQFMASTARNYGLRVDQWVDERLDPEKSTVAAAAYLRDLYRLFGSWSLAQAAYNAGEMTIARAIRATGSSDFWALARTGFLRRETKEFVPQIQAATIIAQEPARYGFDLAAASPPEVDRVLVPGSTDLGRLSVASGISVDTLRALNATLVRGVTPPDGNYELKVPAGTGRGVLAALLPPRKVTVTQASLRRSPRGAWGGSEVHVVRPRDTVSAIAKHYGVSVNDVLRWNSLGKADRIRPGDRLRVTDVRSSAGP